MCILFAMLDTMNSASEEIPPEVVLFNAISPTKDELLTPDQHDYFKKRLKAGGIDIGFRGHESRKRVQQYCAEISNRCFPIRYENIELLHDPNALAILPNHTGPSSDASSNQGGYEATILPGLLDSETPIVLKNGLVDTSFWDYVPSPVAGYKKRIKAKTILATNPIIFNRPSGATIMEQARLMTYQLAAWQKSQKSLQKTIRKRSTKALKQERIRIGQLLANRIANGQKTCIFPEGTRRTAEEGVKNDLVRPIVDGAIDGIRNHPNPEMVKLVSLIFDTYQAMPNGFSGDETLYNRPLTVRAVELDTVSFVQDILEGKKDTTILRKDLNDMIVDSFRSNLIDIFEKTAAEREAATKL